MDTSSQLRLGMGLSMHEDKNPRIPTPRAAALVADAKDAFVSNLDTHVYGWEIEVNTDLMCILATGAGVLVAERTGDNHETVLYDRIAPYGHKDEALKTVRQFVGMWEAASQLDSAKTNIAVAAWTLAKTWSAPVDMVKFREALGSCAYETPVAEYHQELLSAMHNA